MQNDDDQQLRKAFDATLDSLKCSTIGRAYDVNSPDGRDRFYAWWLKFTCSVTERMGQ